MGLELRDQIITIYPLFQRILFGWQVMRVKYLTDLEISTNCGATGGLSWFRH